MEGCIPLNCATSELVLVVQGSNNSSKKANRIKKYRQRNYRGYQRMNPIVPLKVDGVAPSFVCIFPILGENTGVLISMHGIILQECNPLECYP